MRRYHSFLHQVFPILSAKYDEDLTMDVFQSMLSDFDQISGSITNLRNMKFTKDTISQCTCLARIFASEEEKTCRKVGKGKIDQLEALFLLFGCKYLRHVTCAFAGRVFCKFHTN